MAIRIIYAGMCHSDVHQLHGDWGNSTYPMVPGHEIFGVVTAVGSDVTKFAVGQRVGVGCMVDSCRSCANCAQNLEQYCKGCVFTYNYKYADTGEITFGGYSDSVVTDEHFVCSVPDSIPDDRAAPLLCAGITVYSPLERFGILPDATGKRVGVAGLGGLGHMAVKIAKAAGADVVVLSRTDSKRARAEELGASIMAYGDDEALNAAAGTFDIILDTVSAEHDAVKFVPLLKAERSIVMLGVPPTPQSVGPQIIFNGTNFAGSLIGGMRQTQAMLDFCGEHGVVPDVEVIPASKANVAIKRLTDGDVPLQGGRFVIDVQNTLVDGDWQMEA